MVELRPTDVFTSKKILDYNTAIKKITEIKKKNKTVGLCHGGFDLLHPGHIKHLESAKKLCDYLFVSITSDKFVKSRKGSGRPIFSDKLRAYSVASLEFVDYVVISDFERGVDVIKSLKPSYYIKGPDFIPKTTPGITAERQAIKSVGGEIKYTKDPTLSTTKIIKYIKEELGQKKILIEIDRDGTLIEDVGFLGKNENWKNEIKFKKKVIDLIFYAQTKYDTVCIVLTNQAGVARGYFDCKTVEKINNYIDSLLREKGIRINNWQYCPYVDSKYAKMKEGELKFDPDFVKDKTKRKPSPDMLLDGLSELGMNMRDFHKVIILGDRSEDADLAKNLHTNFINIKNFTYEELKEELDKILMHS